MSQTTVAEPALGEADAVSSAMASVVVDIAATQAEQNTAGGQTGGQSSTTTNIAKPPPTTTAAIVTGIVRIIFKLP